MSAWPGLEIKQRQDIASNIRESKDFSNMFKGVTLDSAYEDIFKTQQTILQNTYSYLEQKTFNLEPENLIFRSTRPDTSLWHKLTSDISDTNYLQALSEKHSLSFVEDYKKRLTEIQEKARAIHENEPEDKRPQKIDGWLSARSNLLMEIWKDSVDLREALRQHIDNRYISTLSESVISEGTFGNADRSDTGIAHETRDQASDALDSIYDADGLEEDFDVLFTDSKDAEGFLAKISNLLDNDPIKKQIRDMRALQRHRELDKTFVHEEKIKHLEFMEGKIPGLALQNSTKGRVLSFAYDNGFTIAVVIGSLFLPEVSIGSLGAEFLRRVSNEFLKEKIEKFAENKVGKPGKELFLDKVFSKEKTALTGKIRNWLWRGSSNNRKVNSR